MLFEKYYCYPIITCLVGSDGKRDHTVTIYKCLIFDNNFNNSLYLSQEALGLCCSKDNKPCLFVKFHLTYIFKSFENYWFHNSKGDRVKKLKTKQKKKRNRCKQRKDKKQ